MGQKKTKPAFVNPGKFKFMSSGNDSKKKQSEDKSNSTVDGPPKKENSSTAEEAIQRRKEEEQQPVDTGDGLGEDTGEQPPLTVETQTVASTGADEKQSEDNSSSRVEPEGQSEEQLDGKEQLEENSSAVPDFTALLRKIQDAAKHGFEILQNVSTAINDELPSLEPAEDLAFSPHLVDLDSQKLLPKDKANSYVPLKATADGNCFFRAASLLAFGHENSHEEMRLRTVIELAIHKEFYLNDENIKERFKAQHLELHPSDRENGSEISTDDIKAIYEAEVKETTRSSSWATDLAVCALGAVLKCRVQSVYPECGGSALRRHFNALIRPRQLYDPEREPALVMWTQTGGDLATFTANHFVPLISVDKIRHSNTEGLGSQRHFPFERDKESLKCDIKNDKGSDMANENVRNSTTGLVNKNETNSEKQFNTGGLVGDQYQLETSTDQPFSSGTGSLRSVTADSPLTDVIDEFVKDELALLLDHPTKGAPKSCFWVHLAESLNVPPKTVVRMYKHSDYRPSVKMFEYLKAKEPAFTVTTLRSLLQKIDRNDLARMLDESTGKRDLTLTKFCGEDPKTFFEICVQLDCSNFNNWEALGIEKGIPTDVLERFARPAGVAETVLQIIYTKKPELSVDKMKDFLVGKGRCDVRDELNKLPDGSTIETLLGKVDVLTNVCGLLDKEEPPENWKVLALEYGISKVECDYLCPDVSHSPTKLLVEYISQAHPNPTMEYFLTAVLKIDRHNVVSALKKFFNPSDIDIIVEKIKRSQELKQSNEK